jgi:hypothetical protein
MFVVVQEEEEEEEEQQHGGSEGDAMDMDEAERAADARLGYTADDEGTALV